MANNVMWVVGSQQGCFGNWAGDVGKNRILIRNSGDTAFQAYIHNGTTQYGPATSPTKSLNTVPVVCAVRWNGATLRAFTDGVGGSAASAAAGSLPPSIQPLAIGKTPGSAFGFTGSFAWTVLLNYALCDAEILNISLTKDFGRFLRPANQSPYFVSAGAAATFPFRIGSTQITSASLGSTPITAVYRGATKLWP